MAEPYMGEIRMFAGNFAPAGWMFCEGQVLPISDNMTLYQLIGTTYGGDGQETFNLPNLQSRVPNHMGTLSSTGTTFTIGQQGGAETVTLTTQQLPTHTHPLLGADVQGTLPDPANNVTARSHTANVFLYLEDVPSIAMANAIGPAGGSQPHDNIQPYLCVSFIISLYGIFPHP